MWDGRNKMRETKNKKSIVIQFPEWGFYKLPLFYIKNDLKFINLNY